VTTSFDATSYSWTLRFLKHRIADMRILRLVAKWLRVGVVEAGRESSGRSAPQGAVISPILANIWRRHKATGDVIVVRYADDTIVGFEHEHEAQPFLHDLQERMGLFDLALHPEKPGWSHTAKQRAARGEGKPEVFDFLGFTHYGTRSRKMGIVPYHCSQANHSSTHFGHNRALSCYLGK
jgi:RNA-directed DNA polymerase